jgi:CheY-like chemotaxis protein
VSSGEGLDDPLVECPQSISHASRPNPPAESLEKRMTPPTPHRPARLLVVDDVAENRDLLVRRLQRQGHSLIATACDGIEALDAIRSAASAGEAFDAVLLDVMMPRMSGVEVLEALQADPALAATPVVMISAATELETVVRCIELGAEDYLPKPFNPTLGHRHAPCRSPKAEFSYPAWCGTSTATSLEDSYADGSGIRQTTAASLGTEQMLPRAVHAATTIPTGGFVWQRNTLNLKSSLLVSR